MKSTQSFFFHPETFKIKLYIFLFLFCIYCKLNEKLKEGNYMENYTMSCLSLQEDAHCGDVKCHGESDYFLPEYIINIFVLNSVDFIYLLLSTVKLSSILLYFTILTLQLLGILFKKHLFPSALGVVGSEAILFGKRWAYHLMKRKKSACNRTKA